MLKALVWKEFRELLPICLIALFTDLVFIGIGITQWRLHRNDVYVVWPLQVITCIVFALSAGLWQNSREISQNTIQFLLQRPVNRNAIFGVKIAFGIAACLLVGLMPLACFVVWAKDVASLRNEQIADAFWGLCGGVWLLYCGAFLSSLRIGKWYGSRFYPLIVGIGLFFLLQSAFEQVSRITGVWSPVVLLLGPFISIAFVLAALYVGRTQNFS